MLAVGALEPRKRPDLLASAYERARARGLSAELVVVGEGRLRAPLERAGAILTGALPDAELNALYADAQALVHASEDEGFGFPPLEALARGTPAVVSDLPVFRETLGGAVLRVPKGDADALAGALLRLERDAGLRARLVAAAKPRLRGLSWEEAARATRQVLAEAAGVR